jgi:hypothetical protein
MVNKDYTMDTYNDMIGPALAFAPTQGAARGAQQNGITPADCPADDVFAQALRDDSNRELDWLWVYVQVTDVGQRRYCLERALAINPKSELALRELAKLTPWPAH